MLVYGDSCEEEILGVVFVRLHARLEEVRATAMTSGRRPGALRELLVLAGQIEQAVADAAEQEPGEAWPLERAREVTACAAAAFYAEWLQAARGGPVEPLCAEVHRHLAAMREA